MYSDGKLWIAKGDEKVYLLPKYANRHGLIAGASGTGKTVTIKVMAESFSAMGVPVFMTDVKGDVSGLCRAGKDSDSMQKRIKTLGVDGFSYKGFPCEFWDIYGENGHPVRTTVDDMGPDLLTRIMGLSEVQEDVLRMVFRICRDEGWELIDTKDIKAAVGFIQEHRKEYEEEYGLMSAQSLGAIQRSVMSLEDAGGDIFFGEPSLDIEDWFETGEDGSGTINILNCVKLAHNPRLYSTFIVWLLNKLFTVLPEVGDMDKPKLVFFFDEAHMLFSDAPPVMVQKVEQVVKLIRSKGVGIYFISQSPSDIPDSVLAQLSNRIQHALRAYTPKERKAVKTAAETFRPNPKFDTSEVIMELGTGEALVSFLDEKGRPGIVERAFILPPQSFLGQISDDDYRAMVYGSALDEKYRERVDNYTAYEALADLKEKKAEEAEKKAKETEKEKARSGGSSGKKKSSYTKKMADRTVGNAASAIGRGLGNMISKKLFR
ncbi:MAG: helicase HerA-like domain-containing protein [Candidatus Methanomethylophilaceae archaeon]|jgi:DNA helicase HerA-like ATPase